MITQLSKNKYMKVACIHKSLTRPALFYTKLNCGHNIQDETIDETMAILCHSRVTIWIRSVGQLGGLRSRMRSLSGRGHWLVYMVGLFFVNFYLCRFATSDSGVPPELAEVNEVGESGSLNEHLECLVSLQVTEVGKLTL